MLDVFYVNDRGGVQRDYVNHPVTCIRMFSPFDPWHAISFVEHIAISCYINTRVQLPSRSVVCLEAVHSAEIHHLRLMRHTPIVN